MLTTNVFRHAKGSGTGVVSPVSVGPLFTSVRMMLMNPVLIAIVFLPSPHTFLNTLGKLVRGVMNLTAAFDKGYM